MYSYVAMMLKEPFALPHCKPFVPKILHFSNCGMPIFRGYFFKTRGMFFKMLQRFGIQQPFGSFTRSHVFDPLERSPMHHLRGFKGLIFFGGWTRSGRSFLFINDLIRI